MAKDGTRKEGNWATTAAISAECDDRVLLIRIEHGRVIIQVVDERKRVKEGKDGKSI